GVAGRGPALRRRASPLGRPRELRARRDRLGGRGAPGDRGARQSLARRAHRHGGEPALRRPRDAGDEGLRTPVGVAELDLPAAQRRRREGRAHAVRQARAREVQLAANLGGPMSTVDLNAKIPNNVELAQDKRLTRALEEWLPNYLSWWQDMGPEGFQEKD